MSSINNLTSQDTVSAGDQFPVFATNNGDTRRVSASALKTFVQDDFVPDGGVLAMSGFYAMRRTVPGNVSVGTSYANIPNYETPALIFPPGRSSFVSMETLGEYVATRDVAGVMFWVALSGTWPANRDLTLAILVGTDLFPYESLFQFLGAGRGAAVVSATFGGPTVNLNNPFGTIRAGEKIRLVAKMNTADTLALTKLSFVIQTLDGI